MTPGAASRGGRLLEVPADATAAFDAAFDDAFADPDVVLVHVRALEYGCFLFEVRRPAPESRAPAP